MVLYKEYFKVIKKESERQDSIRKKQKRFATGIPFEVDFGINYNYRIFELCMLKHLEPIQFKVRSLIHGQKSKADKIVFLMDGQIEVGYNHDFLLFSQGFKRAISVLQSKRGPRESTLVSIKTKMHYNSKKWAGLSKKFKFPLTLLPSTIVGMLEVIFNIESEFIYKPHMKA